MFDEKGMVDPESGRKVVGAIKYLVNSKGLSLEFTRVLHECLLLVILIYEIETGVECEDLRC